MLTLTVKVACPPQGHEFAISSTDAAFAILCGCERAILTGATVRGVTQTRVEVLDA